MLARTRAELGRAYHALDVYLVPSRQEGGPKAVLESMATGVPLVTTRVGQAQELVEDGRNGLLVGVDDSEALAASAVRVHADAALARVAPRGRPRDRGAVRARAPGREVGRAPRRVRRP